jgi:hypothetical protein
MESSWKGLPPIRIPEGKRTDSTSERPRTLLNEPVVKRIEPKSDFLLRLEYKQAAVSQVARVATLSHFYRQRRS